MSGYYRKKKLLPLTKERLVEILPKLKGNKFESVLFNVINDSIEKYNLIGYEAALSNSEVLSELAIIKSSLDKANNHLDYLTKNKWAARKCDSFYSIANDADMLMIQLSSRNYDEVSVPNSGYSNTLLKMINGVDAYMDHIKTSKGRDKNFNHAQVIISILEVFQVDGFPYKISLSRKAGLIKLTDELLIQDSRNLVKNAQDYQYTLRERGMWWSE